MALPIFRPEDLIDERFVVRREIGRGGFAAIYEVLEEGKAEVVALKTVRKDDPHRIRLLRREYVTLSKLDHRNIIKVYEFGETSEVAYYTMELVRGTPLFDFIASNVLTLKESIDLYRQLLYAVTYLHLQGVTHRDLKPANILVTQDGWIKLIDFGICRDSKSPEVSQDEEAGTVQWISPEQAALLLGDRSLRTRRLAESPVADVHALGLILYYLLSRRHAYGEAGKSVAEHTTHLQTVAAARPPLAANFANQDLGRIALAMLLPVAEGRPRQAGEVVTTLEAACRSLTAEDGYSPLCAETFAKIIAESRAADFEETTAESRAATLRSKRLRWGERTGIAIGTAVATCFAFVTFAQGEPDCRGAIAAARPRQELHGLVDAGAYGTIDCPTGECVQSVNVPDKMERLLLNVTLITGPIPGQKTYPCTKSLEIGWKGGCWKIFALDIESDSKEVIAAACKSTQKYEPELGWCEKSGGVVYVPVMLRDTVKPPQKAVSPGATAEKNQSPAKAESK